MKYSCKKLSDNKAEVEIIPETEVEKALFSKIDDTNYAEYEFTLYDHYSNGLLRINKDAAFLNYDSFIVFPTKAIVYYEITTGIGGY